jgi:uncharacterized protein
MHAQTYTPCSYATHSIAGQTLLLLPERAIFWKEKEMLLLADLHLGKAGHFRKAGIPVSAEVHHHDLAVLDKLIQDWQPRDVLFLGDLFHSSINSEWFWFEDWLEQQPGTRFTLIKGNHDVLPDGVYKSSRLQIVAGNMEILPFLLTHQPPRAGELTEGTYALCGHIHPAVTLRGAARQELSLPCFYFGLHFGILPAFGKFTGFYKIKPKAGEGVYGVLPNKVVPLSSTPS